MRILCTNDDGLHSPGLESLIEVCATIGQVTCVAPDREQSATSHSLTLHRPLRPIPRGADRWQVDGTPTDCVNIAITTVLKGMPALVVSGINKGWYLGDDISYSGTVSGAFEGALLGVPSIAVSLQYTGDRTFDFSGAARAAHAVAHSVLQKGLPARTFLNMNVPKGRTKGFRVTVQAKRNHVTTVNERTDPRGQRYFWIEEGENDWEPHDRSDYQAVRDGYISVTPLQPDMTAYALLDTVEEFPFATGAGVR
jgi:5'-nucleotidase